MTEEERQERSRDRIVYLKNDFENIVLKSTPGKNGKFFVKHPGEQPYEIAFSTNLVTTTWLEFQEISKE